MMRLQRIVLMFVSITLMYCGAQLTNHPEELLHWCLDGKHHKQKPGPEGQLFSQCAPWQNRSCCTFNTTKNIHEARMYGFNYDHCSTIKNMSESCRRHFRQDHCFFECSPNIGPWVVKVKMKSRSEQYYQVPLCESDCESWFLSCEDDYTCTDNWLRNFIWEKGVGNKCFPGTQCQTFKQIYRNATNFCQKVWDDSWKVVKDSEPCMRLWFDGRSGNPNDNVARYHVEHSILAAQSSSSALHPNRAFYQISMFILMSKRMFLLK